MRRIGILALDLGLKCGWAYGGGEKPPIASTVLLARAGDEDARFATFRDWLQGKLDGLGPAFLVYEEPLFFGKGRNARDIAIGMAAIARELAYRYDGLRCLKQDVCSVKKHFTGSGNARKEHMMQAARDRGWLFPDDNAADALALFDFTLSRLFPEDWRRAQAGRDLLAVLPRAGHISEGIAMSFDLDVDALLQGFEPGPGGRFRVLLAVAALDVDPADALGLARDWWAWMNERALSMPSCCPCGAAPPLSAMPVDKTEARSVSVAPPGQQLTETAIDPVPAQPNPGVEIQDAPSPAPYYDKQKTLRSRLAALIDESGVNGITTAALIERTGLSPGQVTGTVSHLVSKGDVSAFKNILGQRAYRHRDFVNAARNESPRMKHATEAVSTISAADMAARTADPLAAGARRCDSCSRQFRPDHEAQRRCLACFHRLRQRLGVEDRAE